MGAAVAGSHVPRAFLVAGAPAAEFETGHGCEFFLDGSCQALRDFFQPRYHAHWKLWWRQVRTRPQSLPTQIDTRAIATAEMTIVGEPWGPARERGLRRKYGLDAGANVRRRAPLTVYAVSRRLP